MRKSRAIAVALLASCAALVALVGWWWKGDSGPRLTPEKTNRSTPRTDPLPVLVLLAPGTIVESEPSPGWSHPVIKSILHLASGDLDSLPGFAKATATKFRTVVLADVGRDPGGPYRLRRVGAGISLTHKGRDTIVNAEDLAAQGVSLGTLDSMVLGRAETALGKSRLAARSSTFALYETHVELADDAGKHHSILLRYALVLDPATGTLRTACWPTAEAPDDRRTPETLTLLPERLIFLCGVHVEARKVLGVLPSWGIAMTELPPGEAIPMPQALKDLATHNLDEADSAELERAVREALGGRPSPRPPGK